MNRKQQRRERRTKNKAARERRRERIAQHRVHWCNEFGCPIKVMDDPTEEHVNMLLGWLIPRKILTVEQQIAETVEQRTNKVILETLGVKQNDSLQANIWSYLFRLSTRGYVTEAPATPTVIKDW